MSVVATKNRKKKLSDLIIVLAAFVLMLLGYYLLNEVATWEDPILGNTFHIVAGCTMMSVAGVIFFIFLRSKFSRKKRRKRSRPVFLKETRKRENLTSL